MFCKIHRKPPVMRNCIWQSHRLKNFSKFTRKHLCRSVFCKIVGWKNSQNSHENIWARASFSKSCRLEKFLKIHKKALCRNLVFNKLAGVSFLRKGAGLTKWQNLLENTSAGVLFLIIFRFDVQHQFRWWAYIFLLRRL